MDHSPNALSASHLSYTASNGRVLLCDVSFELEQGAILAIAGPNGAGKTTLLSLLAGQEQPSTGEIRVLGQSLGELSARERAQRLAIVSQQSAPDSRLTVRDYVALGQLPFWSKTLANDHRGDLDEILEQTGLWALQSSRLDRLSGGEKQRTHIARALAQRPELLFLDEPTNHLDPDAKGRMLSLVTSLGITVVMVLHDIVMIPEFATHVALLKDTRLAAFGPVSTIQTPEAIGALFGVDYHLFPADARHIPALDVRRTLTHYPPQTQR